MYVRECSCKILVEVRIVVAGILFFKFRVVKYSWFVHCKSFLWRPAFWRKARGRKENIVVPSNELKEKFVPVQATNPEPIAFLVLAGPPEPSRSQNKAELVQDVHGTCQISSLPDCRGTSGRSLWVFFVPLCYRQVDGNFTFLGPWIILGSTPGFAVISAVNELVLRIVSEATSSMLCVPSADQAYLKKFFWQKYTHSIYGSWHETVYGNRRFKYV